MNSRSKNVKWVTSWLRQPATALLSRGKCPVDAKTAACLVRQVHQADQERMVAQVAQVHLVHQVSQADHHRKFASQSRLHHADHAHQANQENQAHKDHPATQAQLDHLATLAKMVLQALPALKVHQAHPVTQDLMDHEVIPVPQPLALQVPLATPAQPAQMDHPAPLVNQVPVETTVNLALQDPKDHQAQLALQAKTVIQATKDHLVPTVPRVNLVFAPNIALWTVVSSSKMAQDAKKRAAPQLFPNCSKFYQNGNGAICSLLLAINIFLLFNSSNK